jgi:hypothetical protein
MFLHDVKAMKLSQTDATMSYPIPDHLISTADFEAATGMDPVTRWRWQKAGKLGPVTRIRGTKRVFLDRRQLSRLGFDIGKPKPPERITNEDYQHFAA